ncbi:MAG: aminotransferase class I/II-fold pyridoxal phosphate-dependent enzyme [Candidatus Altiarchaeales archaeon]|nr:aminotransferase class I/II-fold pyridoxal phosphate-dependent enzyme [Candidatus Altiarchaeales archaeon]MBD3416257.1 aminotransferase class I/II-fold pyridoxal phosphate-dependent enzyme [Candidatus Altiarchaeales archaeon]
MGWRRRSSGESKMDLTESLEGIVPDPIRYWVRVCKDAGAVNMFTIGVPDPIPTEVLEVYAKAVYDQEMKGATGYPPFVGEEEFKKSIIDMEGNFGAELADDDVNRMYVTVGASQGLQFIFSIFKPGSEVLVNTPAWGTIHNMIAHSGNVGVPAPLFEEGRFVVENAEKALTEKTQAVYVNFPANPSGELVAESEIKKMCGWAVAENLQIVSDEPYKYTIFDRKKTPYKSPVSFGSDINANVSLLSSFSKIVKPDVRMGFIRVSPSIMAAHEMVGFYFRNLSAGASRGLQAGLRAMIDGDPKLGFLKSVVEGYRVKSELTQKRLGEWGCEFPYKPAGTYMLFPTTPDGSDAEEWVKKTATEKKCGFIPGTSFGGSYPGFEHLKKHFRMGVGGGLTLEKLETVLDELVG